MIILPKGDINGPVNIEKENYSIKFLEGDFFDILQDIKWEFDAAPEPCLVEKTSWTYT